MTGKYRVGVASVLLALTTQVSGLFPLAAYAQGPLPIPPVMHVRVVAKAHHISHVVAPAASKRARHRYPGSVKIKSRRTGGKRARKPLPPPPPPQTFVHDLSVSTVTPGVLHKVHRGAMYINVLDVDLTRANIRVTPILAGESFNTLDEVRDQAEKVKAIAAVNGNYFKRDGTPLGTLIINGEWIAGPLFDRTCMGITADGRVLVDRVNLHGTLTTSNPQAPSIWVNNINQPRRHGAHLIAYTRRWGNAVKMQYEGTLVAVDAQGQVCAKDGWALPVPVGGYVLSDSKDSQIAALQIGDHAALAWHAGPDGWADVVNAVSGGPVLIRDGKLFVDCKDERFAKAWTGSQIHARTAVGVTANRHLLLATIEGPHTLWDVAKFLKQLGAVDAMNLDGGGSTTMVIGDRAVTRNSSKFERRVASALAIVPCRPASQVVQYQGSLKVTVDDPAQLASPLQSQAQITPSPSGCCGNDLQTPTLAEQTAARHAVLMLPPVPSMAQPMAAARPVPIAQAGAKLSPANLPAGKSGSLSIAAPELSGGTAAQSHDGKCQRFGWMKEVLQSLR